MFGFEELFIVAIYSFQIMIPLLILPLPLLIIGDMLSSNLMKARVKQDKQTPFSWYLKLLGFRKLGDGWENIFRG